MAINTVDNRELIEKEIELIKPFLLEQHVKINRWDTDHIRCSLVTSGNKRHLRFYIDYFDAHKDNSNCTDKKCYYRYLQRVEIIYTENGEVLFFNVENKVEPETFELLKGNNTYDVNGKGTEVIFDDDEDLIIRNYLYRFRDPDIEHFRKKDGKYNLINTLGSKDNGHYINVDGNIPFDILETQDDSVIGSLYGRIYNVKEASFCGKHMFNKVISSESDLGKIGLHRYSDIIGETMRKHNLLIGEISIYIGFRSWYVITNHASVYGYLNTKGELVGDLFYYMPHLGVFRHVPVINGDYSNAINMVDKQITDYYYEIKRQKDKEAREYQIIHDAEEKEREEKCRNFFANHLNDAFGPGTKTLEYKPKEYNKKED